MPRRSRPIAAAFAAACTATAAHRASAQPLPPPITSNDYTLHVATGPVTTATRVIGLAGAYTAIAEWCEGAYANPASPAIRPHYSLTALDYDFCFGFTAPGAFGGSDFENRGPNRPATSGRFDSATTLNLGAQLQYGQFGITLNYDFSTFRLTDAANGTQLGVGINRVIGSVAYGLLNQQLVLGVGLRGLVYDVDPSGTSTGLIDTPAVSRGGLAGQIGAVIRPNWLSLGKLIPFRAGVAFRTPVTIDEIRGNADETLADGTQVAGGKILPKRISAPWELEVGVAAELAEAPMNAEWIDPTSHEDAVRTAHQARELKRAEEYERALASLPEAERPAARAQLQAKEKRIREAEDGALSAELARLLAQRKARVDMFPRRSVVVAATLLVTGASENAVGLAGFLDQRREPFGRRILVSPRLAVETELVPRWVIVRTGTYFEPSPYDDYAGRAHFTGGADVRLVTFNPLGLFGDAPWRLRLAVDGAEGYFNWAFSLGKYH
jgi:hypothetical protein